MHPFRTASAPVRKLVVALLLGVVLAALPSTAHAGEYRVRLTSTSGTHWTSYGGTPFIVSPGRVASGAGTFAAGDWRSWRAQVVGSGARIVGGAMRIGVTTPNAGMRGRIVVGTGNSPIVVHEEFGTGAVEKPLPSGPYDWVQFDISSTAKVVTTSAGQDHVDLQWVDLVLRDDVPPTLAVLALPDPGTWHRADACIPFTIRLTDQGGGLLRSQVRRARDGVVVTELGTTQVQSPKPGPTEQHLTDCIAPGERDHGDTTFVATAWDVSGVARELAFTVRADQLTPVVGGGPAADAQLGTTRPTFTWSVTDQGAGLAGVAVTVDGRDAPLTMDAGVATVVPGELAIGTHVLVVTATDGAGNVTRVERRVRVVDAVAPAVTVTSPGARGGASAALEVHGQDDMSGIDPATWSLRVDGEPAAFTLEAGDVLRANLGPLADGAHRFDVAVTDRAGNRAATSHAYFVVGDPVAAELASRSGVTVIDSPRSVVRAGQVATVTVQVLRQGTGVVAQRVTARRDGVELASAVTDSQGTARIRVPVARPGSHDVVADGMGMAPATIRLAVAPRVTIAASTTAPRVGERVRVTGRIAPALRGRVVSVEARIGGVWFPIRRVARTDVAGRFTTSVTAATPGPIHLRVKLKPAGAWAGTVSNVRLLRVHR